ncbi:hypothetical protein [Ekhidna sp.]|uniref:hypothetical protein n=1 Tax=Ekhidna sp. TaxID=2608089 RepID=UPI00329740D1
MKHIYLILLLFITFSCEQKKVDFQFDPNNIPEEISDRVTTLNLQNSDEKILSVAYERIVSLPSYDVSDEELLVLTDKRFLRYYDFEGEGFIQEFEFAKCIDLELNFDSSMLNFERVKYDLKAISINDLFYNEKENRLNLIPDFKYVHYSIGSEYQTELDSMNSLIYKTWSSQHLYDSLRSINNAFYDENGDWIVTEDRVIEKEKIQSLKNRLEESPFDIMDSYGDLLVVRQDKLTRISYYYYDDQYTITTIKADPLPTDELEMTMLIDYFLSIQDTIELPYELKNEYVNTTYISAQTSHVQDKDELINSYFK